jgi:hypothetical protein
MPIKPWSEKELDRGRERFGKFWSSLRLYYDVPTSNALLTRLYYDVTLTDADQRRSLRLYYAASSTFKLALRHYADLEDCTTISLRRCRSYHACSTFLVRFWRWYMYLGFQKLFFIYFQTSYMNGRFNADLIHLALFSGPSGSLMPTL